MSRKSLSRTPHDEAVAIIEQLVTNNLGGNLEATAACNQCSEELTVNLVAGVSSVSREKLVGTVRPDISLLDENGEPVRFIEVAENSNGQHKGLLEMRPERERRYGRERR